MTRLLIAVALCALPLTAPAEPAAPGSAPATRAAMKSPKGKRIMLYGADGKPHPATLNAKRRLQKLNPELYKALQARKAEEEAKRRAPGKRKLEGLMLRPEVLRGLQRANQVKGVDPGQASVSQWIGIVQRALRSAKAKR